MSQTDKDCLRSIIFPNPKLICSDVWHNLLHVLVPHLDCPPPDCLHGQSDEAGDGVSQGQVVDKVVDIGADPAWVSPSIIYRTKVAAAADKSRT